MAKDHPILFSAPPMADISLCATPGGLDACDACRRNPVVTKPAEMQWYMTPLRERLKPWLSERCKSAWPVNAGCCMCRQEGEDG